MNNCFLSHYISRHEQFLQEFIHQTDIPAKRVRDAILYSLFAGGKRLRPALIYLSGELLSVNVAILDIIAASIEIVHCYSLVHDDLPAMDNDDFRRGKPSCHRAFDEATAILVGDGLHALSIEILLAQLPNYLSHKLALKIALELLKAGGPAGMVSGQSLDLTELGQLGIQEAQLRKIHGLKTGKLFSACIEMTLLTTTPSPEETEALRRFASHLGLVYQMQDDYLDCYAAPAELGKNRSSDAANQKVTFASLYSKDELYSLISQHFYQANQALDVFGPRAHNLLNFMRTIEHRGE